MECGENAVTAFLNNAPSTQQHKTKENREYYFVNVAMDKFQCLTESALPVIGLLTRAVKYR